MQGHFAAHGPVAADVAGFAQFGLFGQVAGHRVGGGKAFARGERGAAGAQLLAQFLARRFQDKASTMPMRAKRP